MDMMYGSKKWSQLALYQDNDGRINRRRVICDVDVQVNQLLDRLRSEQVFLQQEMLKAYKAYVAYERWKRLRLYIRCDRILQFVLLDVRENIIINNPEQFEAMRLADVDNYENDSVLLQVK